MRSQRVRHDWATEQRPANQVDGTFDFHLNPVWYYALTHSCGFSSTGSQLLLALFILPMDALLSISSVQFSSFAACQASLSINNSRSLLKVMSIESVMPSNHLIFCRPLLLPPSIFPRSFPMSQFFAWGGQSIGVSASASVFPMNTQDWSPLGWTDWISLQPKGLSRVFSKTTVPKHQFFGTQLSFWSNSHIHTWLLEKP